MNEEADGRENGRNCEPEIASPSANNTAEIKDLILNNEFKGQSIHSLSEQTSTPAPS